MASKCSDSLFCPCAKCQSRKLRDEQRILETKLAVQRRIDMSLGFLAHHESTNV